MQRLSDTASLWAADAFVDTWKIDLAKSKIESRTRTTPKESVLVIGEKGTDRESYGKDILPFCNLCVGKLIPGTLIRSAI
jgi:hypothetical protein